MNITYTHTDEQNEVLLDHVTSWELDEIFAGVVSYTTRKYKNQSIIKK